MLWLVIAVGVLVAGAAAWLGTGQVIQLLERRAIFDHPNERSSHDSPTPRGGGLAVVASVILVWGAGTLVFGGGAGVTVILLVALPLAAISWLDDLRGLPVVARLAAQTAAVVAGLAALPGPVFQGLLPPVLDGALAAFAWLWFVNLFNFMDGIDGISGVEATAVGAGLGIVALVAGWDPEMAFYGLTLAAAAIGFLRWNWHPARIFLGDVGSVPLGYLIGWLLLAAAAAGLWVPALLLPLYYLADATLTLGRRLISGERVWRAHRSHFYQRAARAIGSHAPVAGAVLVTDLGLVALAVLAVVLPGSEAPSLILGAGLVALLLWYFARTGKGSADDA
jgi:UDP-N-acetylmuramyl pentapeptide phosphotransferase/UDP-N-acetylglucosamine-1-phosphate transferase